MVLGSWLVRFNELLVGIIVLLLLFVIRIGWLMFVKFEGFCVFYVWMVLSWEWNVCIVIDLL